MSASDSSDLIDRSIPAGLPDNSGPALALDMASFRRLGYRAVDLIVEHLSGMRERPVFRPMEPGQRLGLLDLQLPEQGRSPDAIFDLFQERVLPHPMGNGHPRFFGWVNSPPAPLGILGDFLAAAV
jgi:hypothetical protein